MRIKTRVLGGLLLLTLSGVFIGGSTFLYYRVSKEDAVRVNAVGRQRMLTQRVLRSLYELRDAGTPSERERAAGALATDIELFDTTLDAMAQGGELVFEDKTLRFPADPGETISSSVREASLLWQPMRDSIRRAIDPNAGESEIARAIETTRRDTDRLLGLMHETTVGFQSIVAGHQRSLLATHLTLAALVAGACGLLARNINRRVIRPIVNAEHHLLDLAEGSGDLERELTVRGRDEMSELARACNTFTGKVRRLVLAVTDTAEQIGGASTAISSSMNAVAEESAGQSVSTESISAAAEQALANLQSMLTASDAASADARETAEIVTSMGSEFDRTIADLGTISDSVNGVSSVVNLLAESGQRIGDIVSVINDIAEQTNLLALNAAIEAARAGEHGRGFAVVADEVRKLSDRTTAATSEIVEAIAEIRQSTERSLEQINVSTTVVSGSVERARNAHAESARAVEGVGRMSGQVESIAQANREQTHAVEDIARLIAEIAQTTRAGAERTREASDAVNELMVKAVALPQFLQSVHLHAADRRAERAFDDPHAPPKETGERRVDPRPSAEDLYIKSIQSGLH